MKQFGAELSSTRIQLIEDQKWSVITFQEQLINYKDKQVQVIQTHLKSFDESDLKEKSISCSETGNNLQAW